METHVDYRAVLKEAHVRIRCGIVFMSLGVNAADSDSLKEHRSINHTLVDHHYALPQGNDKRTHPLGDHSRGEACWEGLPEKRRRTQYPERLYRTQPRQRRLEVRARYLAATNLARAEPKV